MVVFAPGLLTGSACAGSGRTAVFCRDAATGNVVSGNAGGVFGTLLARLGHAALVIEGPSCPGAWQQLEIGPDTALFAPSSVAGLENSRAMAALALAYPQPHCFCTIGPAGEAGLPMANLAFGEDGGAPASHAAGGAGAVMGAMKLKAVALHDVPRRSPPMRDPGVFAEAARCFASGLAEHARRKPGSIRRRGCVPGCVVACRDALPGTGKEGAGGKWPAYTSLWAGEILSDGTLSGRDREMVRRYAALCDDLGLDAFGAGRILARMRGNGALGKDPEDALALLRDLALFHNLALARDLADGRAADVPGEVLRDAGSVPHAGHKLETADLPPDREGLEIAALMDSLGVCLFAADAIRARPGILAAVAAMGSAMHGQRMAEGDILSLGQRTLQLEADCGFSGGWRMPGGTS